VDGGACGCGCCWSFAVIFTIYLLCDDIDDYYLPYDLCKPFK